ncbi:MAG: prepilin-type N-terminal cleavage/methylation domain-containing protein [Pseudomonadota bacterium]|nr:prepilin-type N-terminal cleavage/methylation domain-containing protein [Xanthomonadaceae bacterium]MDE2247327.1 prepilin-type N-terminal cleavage/methylation domain-containing protein [Xanthomonadaceae bacterium]MDE3209959.1 prepilin-type N-terminal cleavage/methylation domain-containing protein [Pseudomonadota bacterium]
MKSSSPRGFTLIELMTSLLVLSILFLLGLPTYRQWIINSRIRTASESIQNGLRLARGEAAQRSTYVRFQLTSTSGADWTVCLASATATGCPAGSSSTLQSFVGANGTAGVLVGASTQVTDLAAGAAKSHVVSGGMPAGITFTALGRPSDYGNTSVVRIDVTDATPNSRRLVTTISAGGLVDMCDPQITFSANSPQGCR